jgi:hypothetical protein
LRSGRKAYQNGYGPDQNSFPLERNVTFFPTMQQGEVMDYRLRWHVNDTWVMLTNSTTAPVDYLFPVVSNYSFFSVSIITNVTSPYNLAIFFMESSREKIMGSESVFMGLDYGR